MHAQVSTAQYFTWYSIFVPILLGNGCVKFTKPLVVAVVLWIVSICLWLYAAYVLEFLGLNFFIQVWICSLLFQISSVFATIQIFKQVLLAHPETAATNINISDGNSSTINTADKIKTKRKQT
jgi:hypothetical protein